MSKEIKKENFKIIENNSGRHRYKAPLFCPRDECRRITSTMDDEYVHKYGVCMKCYIKLIEGRKEPLIDVEFYRKRFENRGY